MNGDRWAALGTFAALLAILAAVLVACWVVTHP